MSWFVFFLRMNFSFYPVMEKIHKMIRIKFLLAAKHLLFCGVGFRLCWATCFSTLVVGFLCHGGFLTPCLLLLLLGVAPTVPGAQLELHSNTMEMSNEQEETRWKVGNKQRVNAWGRRVTGIYFSSTLSSLTSQKSHTRDSTLSSRVPAAPTLNGRGLGRVAMTETRACVVMHTSILSLVCMLLHSLVWPAEEKALLADTV